MKVKLVFSHHTRMPEQKFEKAVDSLDIVQDFEPSGEYDG